MEHTATAPAQKAPGLLTALLLLFAGAFLRCPPILIHGRIWAEESTIFLIGAWSRSFGAELIKPEFGYYSIWDNLFAALAAHVVPLPWVALLFTWSAVALLLLVGYFVYQAEYFATRLAKTVAVVALVFVAPNAESWLNLINSEFYFGVVAAVILFSDAARLRLPRALMLALAAISGPLTTLIAPFFLIRALLKRQRGEILQAAIVCGGALLQVAVALTTNTANRKVHVAPLTLGPLLFNKEVVLLFCNRATARATYHFLDGDLHFTTFTLLLTWTIALAAFTGIAWLLRRNRAVMLLFCTACWLAVCEDALALNGGLNHVPPGSGERYAFTPNCLIQLALVAAAFAPLACFARTWQRNTVRVLLGLALLSGFVDYVYFPVDLKGFFQAEPFRQQALRWQHDPTLELHGSPAIWPPFHLPPQPQTK